MNQDTIQSARNRGLVCFVSEQDAITAKKLTVDEHEQATEEARRLLVDLTKGGRAGGQSAADYDAQLGELSTWIAKRSKK